MRRVRPVSVGTVPASRVFAGLLAGLVWTAAAVAQAPSTESQQSKGIALIARAELLQKLLTADTGPFRLRATVKLFGLVQGDREGTYVLIAGGPTQWFEQVRFPGYSELTGSSEGQDWRKRNVIDKPYRFHEAARLLSPAHHLRLPANAEVKKLWEKEVGGAKALCLQASPTSDLWQKDTALRAAIDQPGINKDSDVTLCFDADRGVLLSAVYQGDMPRFEYEGQVVFGNKVFPKVLRCFEGNALVVEATVDELASEEAKAPDAFSPPPGAEKWPSCTDPQLPQLVEKKRLNQDRLAYMKARRQFGTVYCLAEVGTDGRIHDFTWVQSRFGGLGVAAKEAVTEWVYKPATCNGVPVPVTIYIAYTFPP